MREEAQHAYDLSPCSVVRRLIREEAQHAHDLVDDRGCSVAPLLDGDMGGRSMATWGSQSGSCCRGTIRRTAREQAEMSVR